MDDAQAMAAMERVATLWPTCDWDDELMTTVVDEFKTINHVTPAEVDGVIRAERFADGRDWRNPNIGRIMTKLRSLSTSRSSVEKTREEMARVFTGGKQGGMREALARAVKEPECPEHVRRMAEARGIIKPVAPAPPVTNQGPAATTNEQEATDG